MWVAGLAVAQRSAAVHEVQPSPLDRVHAIWLNGPTFTGKVWGGSWPTFQASAATTAGTKCASRDDARYTGYDDSGTYCEAASTALDNDAHLLLHSGRLGIVVDAGGLKAAASSHQRNLLPRLGAVSGTAKAAREIYDALNASSTNITLDVTCGGGTTSYVLGAPSDAFVQVGLVRQGHTVTQVTLSGLEFQSPTSGNIYGPCESFVAQQQTGRRLAHDRGLGRCNQDYGGASHACPSNYPDCVGFVPGQSWGQCWSTCTAPGHPNLWGELSVWGDSIAFEVAWDADFDLGTGCTGAITVALGAHSSTAALTNGGRRLSPRATDAGGGDWRRLFQSSASELDGEEQSTPIGEVPNDELGRELHFPRLAAEGHSMTPPHRQLSTGGGRISLVLTAESGSLVAAQTSTLEVTSTAGQVISRAGMRDVFVEIPTSTPKCGYNTGCATTPLTLVDMTATNPHPGEFQTLRLSFSRNFEIRDAGLSQSTPSAEITGLSVQIWETSSMQPSGLPVQISKNWHVGSTSAFWAGFDGYWWTASSLLRVPPNSTITLTLALSYERYGGVPAWSHAQLSIVGYSDKWLWEQAALGAHAHFEPPTDARRRQSVHDGFPRARAQELAARTSASTHWAHTRAPSSQTCAPSCSTARGRKTLAVATLRTCSGRTASCNTGKNSTPSCRSVGLASRRRNTQQ